MDQTDFAIAMVSGILIIIVIFLFILFKIFAKKKKTRQIVTLLPDITKIETHETRPGKYEIKPQEIEGLEKEFPSEYPEKTITPLNEMQIPKGIKDGMKESNEENEKLKLEDILIEIREQNTQQKAKKKSSTRKNLEKVNKLKEMEVSEKKPGKRPGKKVSKTKKIQTIVTENTV